MPTVRVLILRSPGANCDVETQFAFEQVGAKVERLHINRLREKPDTLNRFQVLGDPKICGLATVRTFSGLVSTPSRETIKPRTITLLL